MTFDEKQLEEIKKLLLELPWGYWKKSRYKPQGMQDVNLPEEIIDKYKELEARIIRGDGWIGDPDCNVVTLLSEDASPALRDFIILAHNLLWNALEMGKEVREIRTKEDAKKHARNLIFEFTRGEIKVKLIGNHSHAGETGHIPVERGQITLVALPGLDKANMFEVILDNCPHGNTSCYATKSQVEILP